MRSFAKVTPSRSWSPSTKVPSAAATLRPRNRVGRTRLPHFRAAGGAPARRTEDTGGAADLPQPEWRHPTHRARGRGGARDPDAKAEERLPRLVRFRWQTLPLVATSVGEHGLDGYTLTHHAIAYQEGTIQTHSSHGGTLPTAGRETVMARTRSTYARPRAEVERQIAMSQGWPLPEDGSTPDAPVQPSDISPEEYLRQRLLRLGVTLEQIELLMTTFPTGDIELQLAWLPYRGAKNPASYLVAAITGQYEEPALLKRRREFQEEIGQDASANTSALEAP